MALLSAVIFGLVIINGLVFAAKLDDKGINS